MRYLTVVLLVLWALSWTSGTSASAVCSEYGPLEASSLGGRSFGCLDTEGEASLLGSPSFQLAACDPSRWSQWWAAVPAPRGQMRLVQALAPHIFPAEAPTAMRRLASLPSLARRFGLMSSKSATAPEIADMRCLDVQAGTTSRCGESGSPLAARLSLLLDERGWLCDGSGLCLHVVNYLETLPSSLHMLDCTKREGCWPLRWKLGGCKATPPPLFDDATNLALNAPAIASSVFRTSSKDAGRVTDGYPEQNGWTSQGCPGMASGERSDELFPWVTIDLGASYHITTVQVWNSQPCSAYSAYLCQNRLWGFSILAGDEPPPTPAPELGAYPANQPPCAVVTAGPLGMYDNFPCQTTGRYVTLQQLQSLDVHLPGSMNLCQIRVFGDAVNQPAVAVSAFPTFSTDGFRRNVSIVGAAGLASAAAALFLLLKNVRRRGAIRMPRLLRRKVAE